MRVSQAAFERRCTELMPAGVLALLREGHRERIGHKAPQSTSPLYAANQWLMRESAELKGAHITRAFDEQAIRDHAENYSRMCGRMRSLESRSSFAVSMGIEPPTGKAISPSGAVARLDDPLWWRRQLRKRWTRSAENSMRALGVIRKGRAPYASDEAVRHRRAQKRRAEDFLRSSVAVNEVGDQLNLFEVCQRSLANPALRRGEFMTRVRGFEEIALAYGHAAEFVTLTAPSFFHAQLASGGNNPAYQRTVVREAQAWLCQQWARARAKLKRLSVLYYGVRVAEPHHDATPHWHLLLFVRSAAVETLRAVLRGVWLSEFAHEAGAANHRVKFETVDSKKGSATGYVAKYVAKNIDGHGAIGDDTDDETGGRIRDGVVRVDAWASIHGIRQFQQLGGPPIGLWREFRRLREPHRDGDMERCRERADAGDFRGFVDAVGGIECGRKTNPRLTKDRTGELNRYGELRPEGVTGIRYASAIAITRPHSWRIERKGQGGSCSSRSDGCKRTSGRTHASGSGSASSLRSSLGPVAITVRNRMSASGEPSGWSNPRETSQAGPQ